MVSSKRKINKFTEILIFIFLILFPFGQVIRMNLNLLGVNIILLPIDFVAGTGLIVFLLERYKKPRIFRHIYSLIGVFMISYLLSYAVFGGDKIFIGGLYMLRLLAYSSFFVLAWNAAKNSKGFSKKIFSSLIIVVCAVSIFGFLQYFIYPDIRSFVVWGWDDHYFRLFSTFLDPGHTSIILVFGFLATLNTYLEKTKQEACICFGSNYCFNCVYIFTSRISCSDQWIICSFIVEEKFEVIFCHNFNFYIACYFFATSRWRGSKARKNCQYYSKNRRLS